MGGKKNSFVMIHDWMWMHKDLHLSGNALIAYAVIYGFSKNGEWYSGSQGYIAQICGISRESANKLLQRMTRDGLIIKREIPRGCGHVCDYMAIVPSENM